MKFWSVFRLAPNNQVILILKRYDMLAFITARCCFPVSQRHVIILPWLKKVQSINQSNLAFVKRHLNKSPQRRLLWVGLHKEPSLKARLELFATNTTVFEMRWQHVPNLRCDDAETARTIPVRAVRVRGTIMSSLSAERSRERREQRRSVNRCRGSTLVIGHGYSRMSSAQFWT